MKYIQSEVLVVYLLLTLVANFFFLIVTKVESGVFFSYSLNNTVENAS